MKKYLPKGKKHENQIKTLLLARKGKKMTMDSSSSTYFLSKFNQHIHNLLTLRSIIYWHIQ
jgi:hypothetical protein